MSWEAILTLAVLGAVVLALAWPRMPPDLPLVGGLAVLAVTGCAPLDKVFTGFANPGLIAVAALYVVAAGLQHTGAVSAPARWLFGRTRRLWIAQLRVMFPTAVISGFINNTPVVAALLPAVLDWGKRHRFAASRLAMPLSFAAILGGTCTLIGTSTTIIVNGLLTSATNGHGMGFFTLGAVGLPVAISGFLYILLFGRRLLPDRLWAALRRRLETPASDRPAVSVPRSSWFDDRPPAGVGVVESLAGVERAVVPGGCLPVAQAAAAVDCPEPAGLVGW